VARSEHLPIYKASYDLCLYFEQLVRGFSQYHKYGLGADLRDGARRVLKLVVRANARTDKVPVVQRQLLLSPDDNYFFQVRAC